MCAHVSVRPSCLSAYVRLEKGALRKRKKNTGKSFSEQDNSGHGVALVALALGGHKHTYNNSGPISKIKKRKERSFIFPSKSHLPS